jgi:hypothetical protein
MAKTRWLTILKPDTNCVRKMTIWIPDGPDFELSLYSDYSKTGHLNTETIPFPDVFLYGFRIAFNHPISGPVIKCPTTLDCFIWKKNVLWLLSYKQSRLVEHSKTQHKCQFFEWLWQLSCFNHSKTGLDFFLVDWTVEYIQKKNVLWLFSYIKHSWLVDHSKTRQICPNFKWSCIRMLSSS